MLVLAEEVLPRPTYLEMAHVQLTTNLF